MRPCPSMKKSLRLQKFSGFTATLLMLFALLAMPPASAGEDSLQGLNLLDLGLGGGDDILPPEQAFRISTRIDSNGFHASWVIAEGHYLYQDKMAISTDSPDVTTAALITPPGKEKDDPIFNKKMVVYYDAAEITLPLVTTNAGKTATFKVEYQGCSEVAGICYPPQSQTFSVTLPAVSSIAATAARAQQVMDSSQHISEQDEIAAALASGSTWLTLLIFFGAGLLLTFTPCVFPMIPILSGIIVGQGKDITTGKAFTLSLVYVLAMALTYTIVGVLVGLSGENIQAWFQNPWIIGTFAIIFVALAFSMFGFYELQMPSAIQNKLTQISNSQQGGNLTGVAIMGFLSALIVGPCVTAPLVGALIYIADTGDAVLGGMALFSLSMGMGAPLLLLGTSAGKLLPKAGPWMDAVKAVFGVLLLALAIWLLERVTPAVYTLAMWAALLIVSAIYMGALERLPEGGSGWRKLWKGLGVLLLSYGLILLVGLAAGNRSLLQPLAGIGGGAGVSMPAAKSSKLQFTTIKGLDGFNQALAQARGKTVMLDFYADWCISCKEMEAFTFSDAGVQAILAETVLLKADVTANDEQDKALYKHFGIIGPPSIMFFDKNGNELRQYRVVGFMPAAEFARHVQAAFASAQP